MAYCTHSDLEARLSARKLIQCLDEERLATAVSSLSLAVAANPQIGVRLDAAIADASADCDMFLRVRYATLADVPPSIRKIAIDLALCYAHTFRGSEFEPPEQIKTRRELALSRLESLSQAGLEVGTPAGARAGAKLRQATAQLTPSILEDM